MITTHIIRELRSRISINFLPTFNPEIRNCNDYYHVFSDYKISVNLLKWTFKNSAFTFEKHVEIKKLGRQARKNYVVTILRGKLRLTDFIVLMLSKYVYLFCNYIKPSPWVYPGIDDLRHLNDRIIKHADNVTHIKRYWHVTNHIKIIEHLNVVVAT